jgi:3D (Asp-Asp-Asp) domain-containing protein
MDAVAYSAKPGAGTYINLKAKVGRVAVDPKVIPLGSKLYIKSLDGSKDYGYAIAADTGTAIKNRYIDLFFGTKQECLKWGQRKVKVYILR